MVMESGTLATKSELGTVTPKGYRSVNPCYAIIPAAGSSRRMGQHKLLLPWPGGGQQPGISTNDLGPSTNHSVPSTRYSGPETQTAFASRTVIDRVLESWTTSCVAETFIVVRSDDLALCEACRRWPVTIVYPDKPTRDMKESICIGLKALIDRHVIDPGAGCFIAPADLPTLSSRVINCLIEARSDIRSIRLPRFGTTLETSISGHPALVPWEWMGEIFSLEPQHGVDVLIKRHAQEYVLFPQELAVSDIDTLADYQSAYARATRNPKRDS